MIIDNKETVRPNSVSSELLEAVKTSDGGFNKLLNCSNHTRTDMAAHMFEATLHTLTNEIAKIVNNDDNTKNETLSSSSRTARSRKISCRAKRLRHGSRRAMN